jgi:signal transduction histidine kinase
VLAQDHSTSSPRLLGAIVMLALRAALLARTLGLAEAGQWPWYLAGFGAFLVVMLVVVLRPSGRGPLPHVALAVQSAIVLVLLAIDPQRDFVTVLLVLQCYEAAVVFPAFSRTLWVAVSVALIGVSLVFELGLVEGLALGLVPMVAGVVLAMFVVVMRELVAERAASERMVADLREAQERLRAYAGHADELAAIDQRQQVAAELDRSVAQTLASALTAGAEARRLLNEPELAAPELERLQVLTKQALAQMRTVITELRPTQG